MATKFGFSGVNKNVNPNNNRKNDAILNRLKSSSITTGRVINVFTENTNGRVIGEIEYVDSSFNTGDISTVPTGAGRLVAKPLFTNVKNYPLINELVLILRQPDTDIRANTSAKSAYYLNVLSLWNHPHHNALPYSQGQLQQSQIKTRDQVLAGSVVNTTDQLTNIIFGDTFIERDNINPLRSFEGDIIYEGRWGNSIRFGSTIKTIQSQIPLNNWSKGTSTSGDPILILRNGQGLNVGNGFDSITEDINKDDSSIYLTSTQKIPLKTSSANYTSYTSSPPITPDQYEGKQIIINSGRLVFNSTIDHILLSSNKSINLNAVESFNVDTPTAVFQTEKIFLGSKNANEPLLLGNQTIALLNQLITNLSGFCTICSTVVSTPAFTPIAQLNIAATQLNSSLLALQANLETLKSKYNYTV